MTTTIPLLQRVAPTENFGLVLLFATGEYRLFAHDDNPLYAEHPFLSYPNRLKALTYTPQAITWYNAVSIGYEPLYAHSTPLSAEKLPQQYLRISYKNQAPTAEHATHHWYDVMIRPFWPEEPFMLGESIAGGYAERGGSAFFSIERLLALPDWKQHMELAGCAWIVPLIETHSSDVESLLELLVTEVCRRSDPH